MSNLSEKIRQAGKEFPEKFKQFWSNNTFSAALDNVLAMFPSTILMPLMVNAAVGFTLFDVASVLFLTGIATLFYLAFTGGRLPGYLGSSFAFIGVSSYIAAMVQAENSSPADVMAYVMGAYICSGGFLFLLSLLCKIGNASNEKTMNFINKIIPTAVMGPAISLIGLELSDQAATQAGLGEGLNIRSGVALLTIALVVILSVTRRPIFKKSSILLGVVIASVVAVGVGIWDLAPVFSAPVFQPPAFRVMLPKFSPNIAVMVFPPTLILFCEHIGRKIMIENLQAGFFKGKITTVQPKNVSLFRSMGGNALANVLSGAFGGVPLTLYAENLAVMRINNDARPNQFCIAALIVALLSFNGNLLQLIQSIPDPVLGGLSLVLMGIIAAPGIKMLVDAKVDYSKITNLFLTAAVLIAGLSKMSIVVAGTEFKGMSLGLLVGIFLNAVFALFHLLNLSKEHLGFDESVAFCASLKETDDFQMRTFDNGTEIKFYIGELPFVQISNDFDTLRITVRTDEADDECIMKYQSKLVNGWMALEIDGHLKDKLVKECIVRSYRLTEGLLSAAAAGTPPDRDSGLTPDPVPVCPPTDPEINAEETAMPDGTMPEKSDKSAPAERTDETDGAEKKQTVA